MTAATGVRVLVVDDDPIIRDLLQHYLSKEGLHVHTVADGAAMRQILTTMTVDLVLLDLMLPEEDGLTLTRYFRERSNLPIIILTSKGDPIDRIVGLEMGADDYIVKPFEPREVLARIRSVLRRHATALQPSPPASPAALPAEQLLRFADWCFDLAQYRLLSPHGTPVKLTKGETDLLLTFLRRPHQVITRDQLLTFTRNSELGPYDRGIDVQISRLRRKLEDDPANPRLIKTIRGIGYLFAASVTRDGS